jgi:hypothetical protein
VDGGFDVKRKRFSVEQITAILKPAKLGTPIVDLLRFLRRHTPL